MNRFDAVGTDGNTFRGNDMTEIVDLFLPKLNFGRFECQACHMQRCEHFLERDEVAFERVIDTNQIVHVKEKIPESGPR